MENQNDTNRQSTTTTLETYSGIILTEEETAEALRKGRKEKYHRLKLAEYRQSLTVVHKPIRMDRSQLLDYITEYHPEFDVLKQKEQFNQLLEYFTGESEKGLLLFGGVGCGKTTIMRLFQANPKASYAVRSCREIAQLFTLANNNKESAGGYAAIKPFYSNSHGMRNDFNHDEYGLCFDDLGTESEMKSYGNEANVIGEILLSRYDKRELWKYTHVTTNLKANDLAEKYGERLASRMREMFIFISFKGINDLRTQK